MGVFKSCWSVVKGDVCRFVNEFHSIGYLPKVVTTSFVMLIPKVDNLGVLEEYRLICLIDSLYRILAKLLSICLRLAIGKLISSCQSAFVPNRNMMDEVLITNEIMYFAKKKNRACMLTKVDFEKAYDCVSWKFLRDLMGRMGFGDRWRGWMEMLIFNSSLSILVNGIPTEDLVSRGLRQGDPLSAFLFLLVAEGLTTMIRKASSVGEFEGFWFNDDVHFEIL